MSASLLQRAALPQSRIKNCSFEGKAIPHSQKNTGLVKADRKDSDNEGRNMAESEETQM